MLGTTEVHRLAAQVVPGKVASVALLRPLGCSEEGVLRSSLGIEDRVVDAIPFLLLRGHLVGAARSWRRRL